MRIELYDIRFINVVEISQSGNREVYTSGAPNARYLDTEVFNLFVHCFEGSHPLYDYQEPTRYTARHMVALFNSLHLEKETLESLSSLKAFRDWIAGRFMGQPFTDRLAEQDPKWNRQWENYRNQLVAVAASLAELADRCIAEGKVLWVKGY